MSNNVPVRDDAQHRGQPTEEVLIDVKDLEMHFPVTEGVFVQSVVAMVKAVNGITFQIKKGNVMIKLYLVKICLLLKKTKINL